jgi:hypothetical protein
MSEANIPEVDQDFKHVENLVANDVPGENKFLGQKERRKSSSVKMFLGDYLSLNTNQAILKILAKHGNLMNNNV